ncbi:carboxymuconolactone decarboxylase family protein [Amycolatopsis carbonis]|uniref:Carboxymuconolactone decarboxylase family protein n=1 Tax=Amycolatopsis carbonis TaxID=715471 RepID=A0A9Y2IQK6_9PSEU|nr:carboxymuconolactone decarboxylase family protein [Amycolatopsis sp. 2-15]WIX84137.1 carboxymuconolactone decarboxylase family protein [Amycolatopsis sp. 2-15]
MLHPGCEPSRPFEARPTSNGCAYCVDVHTRDAREHGEEESRIDALAVSRESPEFSGEEHAALELAEAMTLVRASRYGIGFTLAVIVPGLYSLLLVGLGKSSRTSTAWWSCRPSAPCAALSSAVAVRWATHSGRRSRRYRAVGMAVEIAAGR